MSYSRLSRSGESYEKAGKKVVAIKTSGGISAKLASQVIGDRQILSAVSADEAIDLALRK